ncbi:peptidoglycan DD-metalloendopeptidase family protein [Streptomyces sp. R302]|uniref:transglycosylase family protein n=1 Tax=unclassified Streptomyces TaxID=2593676 RepID=UPI00145E9DE6|nr:MULTISPECIES: transglycosylase family protein [unclassified Streptomyces]NML50798.1 peptidoglycan DD-metalloendopeptidase family protein [Streptomyces sp. R301]NML80893.1 peptidoglycan DD-metalloendopeptidase family protein [Streptomyces sp. R302]
MAVRGRHRRHQPSRINRASLTVTAGGAGIALPLVGAGAAQAASLDIWEKVARCESSSNWRINTGNGYFGGLQFSQSTWVAHGGREFAPRADLASKDQQIAVAERVLKGQGPGAWPACGPDAGLARGGPAPDASGGGNDVRTTSLPAQRALPQEAAAKPGPTTVPTVREMYTVTPGDSLSAIARDERVRGGWQRLYEINRKVVGEDPDLILPGQRLTLRIAAPARPAPAPALPSARPSSPQAPPTLKPPAPPKLPAAQAPATKPPAVAPAGHRPTPPTQAQPKPQQKPQAKPQPKPQQQAKPQAKPTPKPKPKPTQQSKPKPAAPREDRYSAPVSADIGTRYGKPGSSWSSGYHTGVDFPVPTGTTVKAVSDGRIVSAGWAGAYGYQIVVRHDDGRYSQYAHLSAVSVREGQRVTGGQRIGRSGSTGNSSGPHLHFEVRTGPGYGSDIDPLAYLRARGVSL